MDGGACNVRGIHVGVDTLGLSMLVGWLVGACHGLSIRKARVPKLEMPRMS